MQPSTPPAVGETAVGDRAGDRAAGDRAADGAGGGERRPADRFRGDVAGLRAVAVGVVLLFHAGLPFMPGGFVGVDVFFVISGYLITGQLLAEIDRTGRISLRGFYARRAKRILPAAAVVLAVTAAATRLILPRGRWEEVGGDILAAAAYVVNWRFAERSVDYLAEDGPLSPVQHFWSLAVEEQFYLVWPLLILAVILLARLARRADVRPVLWLGLAVVAVPSFAWSVIQSQVSPDRAFFVSTTRMWELAIGAGVALLGTSVDRLPRRLAVLGGWLGLAAIAASALFVTAGTAWPGYAAAVPTLGAAAVIAAGTAAGPRGPVALLGTRPFRWVGDLSYSLYLWHWPMLVLATAYWGGLSIARGLAVAAVSVIPAWITFRLVENPLRYSPAVSRSPRLALSIGGNFTLVGMCAGLVLLLLSPAATGARTAQPPRWHAPGAAVLAGGGGTGPVPDRFASITPDPLRATLDLPESADGCFQQIPSPELIWCSYGNPRAATTVALVGDSKMDQWLPAFRMLAAQYDWRLDIAFKGACPFTAGVTLRASTLEPYPSCTQWNRTLMRRLVAERPDIVVTSHGSWRAADAAGRPSVDAIVDGMRAAWSTLRAAGTRVVVLANNPSPGIDVMECVDRNRTNLSACAFDRGRHLADMAFKTQRTAVAGMPGVALVDMFDVVCPGDPCPAVIGGVLVYRRGSHLTATYILSLTPFLARALAEAGVPVA